MGSGTILNEVLCAQEILLQRYNVNSDVWSLTSINQLVREGQSVRRWNLLHPTNEPKVSFVEQALLDSDGPVVIATDYMKNYGEQLRAFIHSPLYVLGTDGFGRSDSRESLRYFFEVDRNFIVVTALKALSDQGKLDADVVLEAITSLGIDSEKCNPLTI